MPVTITNLQSSGPLYVRLTSGRTLRLSPGQRSEAIADVEVQDNDQVGRLMGGGLVEVAHDPDARARSGGTRGRTSTRAKSKSAGKAPSDDKATGK
jgi:hypothetical protein